MNTTSVCGAPTPLAFAVDKGQSSDLLGQIVLSRDGMWHSPKRHAEMSFQVLEGIVWITEEGDPCDHVVREGESFRSAGHTRVVAQSLCERSRVLVQQ